MATIKNKIIKNFFSPDELDLLQRFSRNKLDQNVDWIIDDQSFSPAWYDDPLMNGVLYSKLKRVEHESNLNLIPTYSYWRYYVFGGELGKHTDRPSCEVSVTACIKKYDDWPIIVEGNSFELEEGDAVLYDGLRQEHWRPGTYKGEGQAQVFFHYVNKDGLFVHHGQDKYSRDNKVKWAPGDKEKV